MKREKYISELSKRMHNGLVKVIVGAKASGKSYLLNVLFYDYLLSKGVKEDHTIRISLEHEENSKYKNAFILNSHIKGLLVDDDMHYVIIDEIQEVNDFVPLLNGLMKYKNIDIYVSSSNSKYLTTGIATQFRGRSDKIEVFPLSFKEYYDCLNQSFEITLEKYLRFGGLPFTLGKDE